MKEWISENKFLATLIGVVVLIVGLLGFLKYSQWSKQGEDKLAIKKDSDTIAGYRKSIGDPTESNKEQLEVVISEGEAKAISLHTALSSAGIHEIDTSRSNTDFATLLGKYIEQTKKTFVDADVVFPKDSSFGFGNYKDTLIKQNNKAIGLCLYQQEAFSWFFDAISSTGPLTVKSMYREPLSEEAEVQSPEPKSYDAVRRMRVDFVLKISEEQLSKIMDLVVNSNDHLFVIKEVTILNDKVAPIPIPDIMSGKSGGTSGGFDLAGFDEGDSLDDAANEESGPARKLREPAKPGKKVVDQVLGKELLTVGLAMDLVLITEIDKLKITGGSAK